MRRELHYVAIVLTFAGLTLLVTYPVITQLGTSLAQNPRWSYDAFQQTYELWWFKQALLDIHTSPGNLRWIYFPTGAYYPLLLTYSTVYAVGVPFLLLLSPTVTYNVLFLLTFFLSGLSGYALCTYLTRNRWAGLLGGIVYAFFPSRMAHALAGHLELVSTYLFPLYLLLLIKTVRQPRPMTAVLCGLTLAGSLLVQPLFIPFLLVPTTVTWLLCETLLMHQRIERGTLLALAGAFGLAVLIAAPLFWPVLHQQALGQGSYLEDIGVVRFSADLLGIVAPSPVNPLLDALGMVPAYAHRVAPPDWRIAELLTYAGIVPLALGVLAAVSRRREMLAWALVAIFAAILSLGPVLKVNGEVVTFTADDVESTVALPYALLTNVPLLSLNRAPARINTTFMLALAVLSAHGLAWLMERAHRVWKYVAAAILCVVTLGELLVSWPCPTTPLRVPAYLSYMNETRSPNQGAVLNLPITAGHVKQLAIFYQTIHGHPVFDSWFQRPLPVFPDVAEFLDGLLNPEEEKEDIIPSPGVGARAAIARAEKVSHVFLYTPYVGYVETKMERLKNEFGPPRSTEKGVAIYEVSPGPETPDELVYVLPNNDSSSLEHGWQYPEYWNGRPARWMPESAELYIYSPHRQKGTFQFTALPFITPQRLQIEVNKAPLSPLVIGEWITYTTSSFDLQPGINQITLQALGGCSRFVGDPRCSGVSLAITRAGHPDPECAPYLDTERCLGILFQDIRFSPNTTTPASHPLDVVLGDQARLVGYDLSPPHPTPGQHLTLVLYWQALQEIEKDYTIFVHLLGSDGNLLAQHDAPPVSGVYPTSQWIVNDIFTQQISLHIPPDTPPGDWDLLVGMYTYPDLTRLPVTSDRPHAQDGLIWLESVNIP
ncbi:MAG: hypothetical protein SXV54_15175 [Chloroflexota bacterium]|nr:hypothetical protein [Chloroflexota bacterium]